MRPVVYLVPRAIFAPACLTVVVLILGVVGSLWWLLALPFVILGSVCAAPNFNLADGFLALLAMVAGVVVFQVHETAGTAIVASTFVSWLLSSFEKQIRSVPMHHKP